MKIFKSEELQSALQLLHGWTLQGDAIEKKFQFHDFKQALAFIVQVGILAEQDDHHPEIFNVYNQVKLRLNTHSEKAITDKDTNLALKINALSLS
ncbi:MAG: 4a-hydroxytetrahydrobiopterin dehydratase [Bacteroidetes bacterium]|nr:4a-hydroxytetrahydrobiopterin dehydratase [Bacteroidota bacterium]